MSCKLNVWNHLVQKNNREYRKRSFLKQALPGNISIDRSNSGFLLPVSRNTSLWQRLTYGIEREIFLRAAICSWRFYWKLLFNRPSPQSLPENGMEEGKKESGGRATKLTVMFYMFHPRRIVVFILLAIRSACEKLNYGQDGTQANRNIRRYWKLRFYGKAFYFPITTVAQSKYFGKGFYRRDQLQLAVVRRIGSYWCCWKRDRDFTNLLLLV